MKNLRSGNRLLDAMPHQPLGGPTLFGRADSAQSEARQKMLHALERKKTRRTRPALARSLALALGLLGLLALGGALYPQGYVDRVAQTRPAPVAAFPAVPRLVATEQPPAVARIETGIEAPVASPFAKLGDATEQGVSPQPEPMSAAPKPNPKQAAIEVRPARPAAVVAARPTTPREPATKREPAAKKPKDADVALLQALVTHVESQKHKLANDQLLMRTPPEVQPAKVAVVNEETKKPSAGDLPAEGPRVKSCGDDDPSCAIAERLQSLQPQPGK